VALYLGALSLLGIGAVHLEQYYVDQYSILRTIGSLFLLNFISAAAVAVGLVAPLGRLLGRFANFVRALLALSGIGIAITSLIALFISESSGLFGFMELGYRTPVVLSIAAEVAAALFLTGFLVVNGLGVDAFRAGRRTGRRTSRRRAS
jgi:hypothetical protein